MKPSLTSDIPYDFRILVVDDQATQRLKLKAAVEALGFASDQAEGGPRALQMMKDARYSLVLLDILMPDMDGFEVMSFMKRDRQLRDIPVIVISALEGEMSSVVRAIEMGAEDFLPKQFDQVVLAARLDSALESRRALSREREQQGHIEKLTQAAAILENQVVNPDVLQLRDTAARKDDVGKLARVFLQMTSRIHDRETQLSKRIRMIRTGSLLLGVGVVGGACIALAREAVQQQPHPLGIVLWVNLFCACICLPIAAYRQSMPKPSVSMQASALLLGIFTLMLEVPLLWAAKTLSASLIVMILAVESLIVLTILLATRTVQLSMLRIAGVVFGLLAVAIAVIGVRSDFSIEQTSAAAVLTIAPLAVTARSLYWKISASLPHDTFALVGSSALAGALLIAPVAVYMGDLASLVPESEGDLFVLVIVLLTVVTMASTALRITLIQFSEPLHAVRASLAIMVAGLIWSYLLHGDVLPAWGWLSCALLLLTGIEFTSRRSNKQAVTAVRAVDIELG